MVNLQIKKKIEQFDVIPVFFFKNEVYDAVKKDKTISISHFAAEPLMSHTVSNIRGN